MKFFLPSARRVLERLCSLDQVHSERLLAYLQRDEGGETKTLTELAAAIGMGEDAADELVSYCRFLRGYHAGWAPQQTALAGELALCAKEYDLRVPDRQQGVQNLSMVLCAPADAEFRAKVKRVAKGLGSELGEVSSIVDLRPVFDEKREVVRTWVPGITLRLEYTSPAGDDGALLLSMTEADLQGLSEAVSLVKKKLEKLRSQSKDLGHQ